MKGKLYLPALQTEDNLQCTQGEHASVHTVMCHLAECTANQQRARSQSPASV